MENIKIRRRVGGIILNDEKLLLIKENHPKYSIPGGEIDLNDESGEYTLKRELKEELGIIPKIFFPFSEYSSQYEYNKNQIINTKTFYIPRFEGEIVPGDDITSVVWSSGQDFESDRYPVFDTIRYKLVPDLRIQNLI